MKLLNFFLKITACTALASPVAADECRSLDEIDWMLGNWQTLPGRAVTNERWRRVSEATFEGEATTLSAADGKVINRETLRLVEMSGRVFYMAKVPHNDLPVAFRLTRCSAGTAVFENPVHDSPQRIAYRLLDATGPESTELEVKVEGERMKGFSLYFRRQESN